MRIILLAAAAAGAAALATAAEARPGGSGRPGGAAPAGFTNAPGTGSGDRLRAGFRFGGIDRGHRRSGRQGRHDFVPYGGAGIAGPFEALGPWGTGFFARRGGRVVLRGGHPHFDYDRSYPYEWGPAAGARDAWEGEARAAERPAPRCTMENGVRVCRGW